MVVALGADAQPLLGLLAEDGGLAAGAAFPEPLGHAPLGVLQQVLPVAGIGVVGSHAISCSAASGRWPGSTSRTSQRPCVPMAFQRSPNSSCLMNCRTRLAKRLGHHQGDHALLVTLQQLGHGRADPLVGLAEHFALGRTDVLRLLLPLAVDLGLLVPDVAR